MTLLKAILCFALASAVYSHGAEHDHTADCRKVESLFYSLCSPDPITLRTIQGAPGKSGSPGVKGDVGMGVQGPPGVVDYDRVDSTIDRKLEQVFSEQNAKIAELTASLARPEEERRALEGREGRYCSIEYEGICYRVIGRFSLSVRYNHFDAISECRSVGGELTHVVDKTHYDMIWNWVRSQHSGTVWIWLGMYHRSGRTVLANGQPAPYVRWHSGFPMTESSRTKMGMRVEIGPAQHMFNDPDHYTLGNALCRIG